MNGELIERLSHDRRIASLEEIDEFGECLDPCLEAGRIESESGLVGGDGEGALEHHIAFVESLSHQVPTDAVLALSSHDRPGRSKETCMVRKGTVVKVYGPFPRQSKRFDRHALQVGNAE
jgi:hypothetical protein